MLRLDRLIVCTLLLCLGCAPAGPKVVPVTGQVSLDGKPVSGATVLLMPGAEAKGQLMGTAQTNAQGAFQIISYNGPQELKGAVEGSYQVAVIHKISSGVLTDENGLSGGVAPEGIKEQWLVPQKFAGVATSGLKADIKAGMGPLDFKLTSQ